MKPSFTKLKFVLSAVIGLLFSTSTLTAQVDCQNQQSTAFFDINQCSAGASYDEFTANVNNGIGCTTLSIVGGNLFRDNPGANPHSCTLGLNGTNAMCISTDKQCSYDPDSDKALIIEVQVTPGASGSGSLDQLNFYETAPMTYNWLTGGTGLNNFPTKFGIRVIKNGTEIFEQDGYDTSPDWNLQNIDFSGNSEFTVTSTSTFRIELSAYCATGNGGFLTIWDLENIELISNCDGSTMISGGTLDGGPYSFCVGDGVADNIPAGDITLTGNTGTNSQWVITDDQGVILGLPPSYEVVDFDGAGTGTCLVWHLSFEDGIMGAAVGMNANDLQGCFSLSNPISVNRNTPLGGTLTGGPYSFCVGDGVADNIPAGDITLTGNSGTNSQWVITDDQGVILGLPPSYEVVDFDGAGTGTCLVWHLSFEDGIMGAAVGMNANDLQGCFSLSNPISVNRNTPLGGTLAGGPYSFCVGDGVADNIPAGDITLTGNSGTNSQWVITDDQGVILGLPPSYEVVDFDGAGTGTCLVWHLSFEDGIMGAAVGMNANDLQGCFSLSNPISVNRTDCGINGGIIEGGPFTFCVGDGIVDNVSGITLSGNTGTNNQWVITDDQGNILGLPPMPGVVDFDGAGPGTCLIWNLTFNGTLTGAEVGNNALTDLSGTYALSNSITVIRNQPEGGNLLGGPFTFCVGDGEADMLPTGSITLSGNSGGNSQWVVTDDQGMILGLPPMPGVVDFDGAGFGNCLVWHLSYEDGLQGAEVGLNANDLEGCFSLSNPVTINRIDCNMGINGGLVTGGPFTFCVGDGIADNVSGITLENNTGMNNQWVVTDDQGNILGLPPMPGVVDFDEAGPGTCLIWNLSFADGLTGAEVGNNALTDLVGNYGLSNPVTVYRNQPEGGTLEGGPFEFCAGDGEVDMIPADGITVSGNSGGNSQWVITDDQGNILGLPPTFSVVDFDGAGFGNCLVWHLSYEDGLQGAEVGLNANELEGCYSLSNPIEVIRTDCGLSVNQSNKYRIQVYPNPSKGQISLKTSDNVEDIKSISIFDTYGKIVKNVSTESLNDLNNINISELNAGQYYVRLRTGKMAITDRFIVVE